MGATGHWIKHTVCGDGFDHVAALAIRGSLQLAAAGWGSKGSAPAIAGTSAGDEVGCSCAGWPRPNQCTGGMLWQGSNHGRQVVCSCWVRVNSPISLQRLRSFCFKRLDVCTYQSQLIAVSRNASGNSVIVKRSLCCCQAVTLSLWSGRYVFVYGCKQSVFAEDVQCYSV